MSDYEIAVEVADRLGVKEQFTKGQSIPDKIKEGYEISGIAHLISWEEFNEKQYFVAPTDPDWEKWPAGTR